MGLLIPALSGADLSNTAQLSFQDTGGLHTLVSNTVTVAVTRVIPPPAILLPPDLSSLNGKTLSIKSTLTFFYPYAATGFNWQIASGGSAGAVVPAKTMASTQAGALANVPTSAPALALSSLLLTPGPCTIQVQTVNGSQTSAWASASVTLVSADLSAIKVYPNPWRNDKHHSKPITFGNLPAICDVKIFTLGGQKVNDLGMVSGSALWDLTNDSGDKVASGIYVYLITDEQGNKVRGKVAVIK